MDWDAINGLLDRLPEPGATRAARWLLWSVIAHRIGVGIGVPAVVVAFHVT